MPTLRNRSSTAAITIAGSCLLAFLFYWPGLNAAFMGDDYRYMLASRDMSWGNFLHHAFAPWVERDASEVAADHWRPLSWTYFRIQYMAFGDEPMGYHLTSLAAHLGGIVAVWFLAVRLRIAIPGAVAATVIFALHPAGFESVTWISALSLVGFPLALAGWIAFISAAEASSRTRSLRLHAVALALFTVALLNRETASAVFPAMGFWFLLVQRRDRLHDLSSLLPLAPYVALFALYMVVSTWFFTVEDDQQSLSLDRETLERGWFYVKQALFPAIDLTGPALRLQQLAGLALLTTPFIALYARRWTLLALWLGFFGAILPYAVFSVGYGPRYFYFPGAFLALALGATAAELRPIAARVLRAERLQLVATSALVVGALAVTVLGARRVDAWVERYPSKQELWTEELLATYPEYPEGTLYVTNLPEQMALFFAYVVQPTIQYLYPGEERKVQPFFRENLEEVRPFVLPEDGLFIYGE